MDPVVAGDCEGEGEREGDERGLWHGGRAGGTGMCVRFVVGVGFWVWTNDHSTLGGLKFSKAINLERYLPTTVKGFLYELHMKKMLQPVILDSPLFGSYVVCQPVCNFSGLNSYLNFLNLNQ